MGSVETGSAGQRKFHAAPEAENRNRLTALGSSEPSEKPKCRLSRVPLGLKLV